jgi:hypothetical protein
VVLPISLTFLFQVVEKPNIQDKRFRLADLWSWKNMKKNLFLISNEYVIKDVENERVGEGEYFWYLCRLVKWLLYSYLRVYDQIGCGVRLEIRFKNINSLDKLHLVMIFNGCWYTFVSSNTRWYTFYHVDTKLYHFSSDDKNLYHTNKFLDDWCNFVSNLYHLVSTMVDIQLNQSGHA